MYKKLLLSLLLFSMTMAVSAQRRSLSIASVNEMAGSVSVGNLSSSISASSTTAGLYNVTNGTTVQIVATANAGYNFVCWREGVSIYSRTADTTVTVRSNRSLTAVFVSVCDTMTLAVNDTTMGSIEMLYEFTPLDTVDLSTIQSDYTVQDGTVLTGTLGGNRRISVADGASIMLSNMAILGVHMSDNGSHWAGLTLLGDATIVLDGGTANYIRGFNRQDPGILVPVGATLTICGSGELTAESGNSHSTINDSLRAAGIGGGYNLSCGNIVINGGTITTIGAIGASLGSGYNADCGNIAIHGGIVNASSIGCGNGAYIDSIIITGGTVNAVGKNLQSGIGTDAGGTVSHILITGGTVNAKGGAKGAGIGCGQNGTCTDITITGGTVVAEGGIYAAGIGSGEYGHSYNITIASTVASVTAKKGMGGNDVKNIGNGDNGSGGTITVGGQPYTDPNSDVSTYTGTGDNSVQEKIAMSVSLTDGRYSAPRGKQVVARATAKQGYHLDAWSDGAAVNTTGTDTITVNSATTLTAFFAQDSLIINVTVIDTNSGNAVVIYNDSAASSHLVEPNTNNVITISATAKYGYHFDRWEEVDTMYNFTIYSRTADTTVSATGDRWFYAFFEPNLYTIATNTADTNMGTAAVDNNMQGPVATSQPSVEAEYNSWVMLTATPKPGYRFVCWREADSVYSHTADTFVVVTADRSFTAEFDISAVDLAITNVNLDVATSNVPQFTINVTNNGTEDLTGECCIRIYKDYLGGDTVADCAMSARSIAAGETRSLSYYFFTSDLCSLGEGDSLVFEVRTDSTQPDTIATNNVAGLNIGTIFPWRNTYEYVSDTVCDSLRWTLNNHLYRESGTYEYSAVTNYNGGQCDSIVVLDLTVNHGYSIDTFAIELDSYNWRGNEFRIVQTATFSSQVTMQTATGCDSTVTLHLMLIPTDTVTLLINDTTMGSIELAADTIHLDTLTADFTAQDGAVLTGRYDGAQHRIYIADGATVTLAGIDIPGRDYIQVHEVWNGITCLGDATLLLADGTMNKVNAYEFGAGIFVPQGNTLAIYGSTGWLNATSPSGAGIGGGTESMNIHTTSGNIVIYGGNIIARCSEGSGIGSYTGTCGDITIHGGNIYATSLNSGAAIGSGAYGYCGNILITGGTVSATSGGYGAAIGTGLGDPYAQNGVCGDITIMGGNITALTQTYRDLAAIGAGTEGFCGNILIAGGTVDATGPVAIGANVGHCGDIVVANTVTRMVSHTTYNYAFGDSYGAHVTIGNSDGIAYNFTADTDFYGTQPLLHPAPVSINYPSLITPIGNGRYRVAQNQNVVAKATPISCHHFVSWSTADSVLTTDSAFLIPHSSLNQYTNTPLLATLQRDIYTSDTTVHAVNHYIWNGTEYTTGGDIQDRLYTAEGCDSLATLHLTLDYIDTITLAVNDTNMGSIKMLYAFTPLDTVDLSTIHSNYTVQDGTVLTGTLGTNSTNPNHPSADNRKISVAAGATVMLSNMDITGVDNSNFKWAGLTLLGDATIVLDDNTSNYIRGFYYQYPGIYVPGGATLTICGSGELTSESGKGDQLYDPWWAPGIGGAYNNSCGNIVVEGGTITTIGGYGASLGGGYRGACGNIAIHGGTVNASSIGCGNSATIDSILITGGIVNATAKDLQAGIGCDGGGTVNHIVITGGTINATGGRYAAGIGSGYCATVNHITITGGTITATGGQNGAGIGAGEGRNGLGHCGEIVIASTVTSVTAQKGTNNTNVNNIGHGDGATCDTVIVGGQPYTDPDTSTYTYTGTGSSDNVQHYITAATPLPDGRYTVLRGTQVVAKATPKANHHLASWSDGATVNASGTDTISTNGSVTITAFFEHDPYIVNVAVLDTNSGNAVVIYNDSAAISLPVGTDTNAVVAISATAKYGYHFDRWEEVDTMYNFTLYSHTADTSVRVTGDRLFYAYFEPNIYTISTYTADTTMGTAAVDNNMQGPVAANQPSVQAEYNSWLMLTATPKRGYHFVQWEEADSVYSHTADTFVVVNADRSFTAVFAQDSHSFVEMGDGLRWATNNIGADNQWDVGDYFAWGETEPKNSYSWSTYRFNANGSNTDFTRYTGSDYDTLLAEDDAATANWGRGWRMATRDEWQTLMNTNNYSWQWTNNYNNTGNRGFTVTRLTGPCAGNTIFLPANGYMDNYWLNNRQSCRYWSSTIASDNINAWKTTMDNSNFSMHEAARYLGGAVRAVGHTSMISVAAQSDDTTMGTAGLMVATPGATAAAVLEQRVTVDTGATVTLSATPKIGYIFVRWMEADTTYSLSADTVITVMGERSMKAFFAVHPVDTLILAVNDTSMGSIAIEGAFTPTDTVDLATLTGDYTVQDGTVLTGTLTNDYKISVAAGASVLLKGMIIPGISTAEHPWAGLSLLGDATLFLDDSSYVKGYHSRYPGIHVPAGSTLTIRGVGILTAQPCSRAAAIGGGYEIDNGNIVIESGTIHAHGYYAAGIGGGYRAQSCGNITIRGGNIDASSIGGGDSETIDSITITGGTVIATGNDFEAGVGTGHTGTVNHIIITGGTVIAQGGTRAAGIGGGIFAHCGEIVIDSTVTLVTSSKGHLTDTNIGTGFQGTFDTIIVAGQGYTDVSNPFSYSGNGSGNQFEPSTVIDLGGDRYKVLRGRQVVVQATAKPGHHLASWSDGAAVNAAGTDTLTVNGSMTLTAIFEHDAYQISAMAVDTAMGSAVVIYNDSVAATLPVLPDSTFILEATANPCYHFVCWTKGADTVASESIIELQATDTSFYIAHFERNLPLLGDTTAVVCDSLVWFGTAYTATDTATHNLLTAEGCDSTVTLHLTVKYSSTGDTTAVVCDLFMWYDSIYTATSAPTHRFANAVGCDSTVTLNLTVNYKNTGDTVAVVCDSFAWYGDTYTASNDSLTHFMEAANQWGCDSTVILHLTVNYQNSGDTTAVECDHFSWYEHQGLTASTDTLTHLLANQWGCDSTVTLHLTVNYQNSGDTAAVECDQFTWYEHTRVTASTDTLTHLFASANQWGCDSTVTLHLTVNYQNTGDTAAMECDQFSWYEHQNMTASDSTRTHLFAGANQWGCDSTVTLHLTINYQNTGDTTAVECDQFSWYEHQNMTASDSTRTHLFAGANQWGCDSTVTLHLTVNYSNTGDTAAVVCDSLVWYDSTYTLTAAPTHVFANQWGCDSTVTLSLTVNYSSTSDTTAVECDQFAWNGTTYTASGEPERHYTNAVGCDSTRTLHLTINYQNTGDTTAVECDQFSWYEHDSLTASSNTLTHLFQGANQWGCDSTVTLNLTVNYKNTGDTTIVACDQYSWYEHTGLTASVDTLKHLFVGGNRWGCDSTTTLHLTVNYQNTGDTTAVECDHFTWYQHHNLSTSSDNRTHRFLGANQWGCDSTVTLHLTVNYSNTGDTTAVECDLFSWYEHQNLTSSSNNKTHRLVGANQWGCDSTVTLHLTVNYQNTGDTSAVTYEPFTWYEHTNMGSTQNVQHTFAGSNRWGCDSTVTLHLRYALFTTSWSGATTVTYNSQPQNVISATYVDDTGRVQQAALTFTNGTEVISTPNYPVGAGVWAVVARPMLPVDSLSAATTTLTILPATVSVSGAVVRTAKVIDGTTTAEVIDPGVLNNIQGSDPLTHTTTAEFSDATVGQDKTITLTYTLHGDADLLSNYTLQRTTEVYSTLGAIVDPIEPDPQHTFDLAEYGYCTGSGAIGYHLSAGSPDQYKIDFADSRIADVDWTNLATTEPDGTISIDIPEGLPMGDYSMSVTFRNSSYTWIESAPMALTIHVNLPASYTKPLFYNVIILIDTCECITDVQWYHREVGGEWAAIPGANDYNYRQVAGLTGEYFAKVKMNGVETYTCPQSDLVTLVRDEHPAAPTISAHPNPTTNTVTIELTDPGSQSHLLRVVNTTGVEMERRTFDGNTTTIEMSHWQSGSYIVSVDGLIVRIVKN